MFTCVPLSSGGVHLSVHLLRADGLGVEAAVLVRDARGLVEGRPETAEDLGLAAPGGSHEHDPVPHQRRLVQLVMFFSLGWGGVQWEGGC